MEFTHSALEEAARRAGSRAALARKLGISPQAVRQWRKVPPERAVEIERLTGVPREELRPDLFRQTITTKASLIV